MHSRQFQRISDDSNLAVQFGEEPHMDMVIRPTSTQNTGMASNYSTTTAAATTTTTTTTPSYTTAAHNSIKKDFSTCEKSTDGGNLLLWLIISTYASVFLVIIISITWLRKYQALKRRIMSLQNAQQQTTSTPSAETDPLEQSCGTEQIITVQLEQNAASASEFNLQNIKSASSLFNKADLTMHQLIKSGKEGMLYKAKMSQGTIKGHTMFTCKIYNMSTKLKQVRREIMIMRNLNTHMNLLQLVDWDITEAPYMLIMEDVEHGSLRTFLKTNKESLVKDQELKHLFTIALYHIAQALDHLHSKMILHCNLALRNIMVHRFPHEVKVAEFGLARHIMRGRSLSRNCKKTNSKRVPIRWYPPEYFKHDFYGFKGDVWAFGIVIWEMQTFGTVPYPNLKTSEEVVSYVCAGHRSPKPKKCRPEMLQMMRDCWHEPYFIRPSFMDIIKVLENILENDRDYVNIDISPVIVLVESEDGD